MPEKKPVKEDFCWVFPFVSRKRGNNKYLIESFVLNFPQEMPFRPIPIQQSDIDLTQYHCAALEHASNMYRLYYYGDSAKGVFRGDAESADIVCNNIPIEDEYDKFRGILVYNKDAFEKELKMWRQYWEWKEKRNKSRWIDQEKGNLDYDAKNMMHCMRLLYEGEHILQYGYPKVRFEGTQLQRLKDIRFAKLPYEEVLSEAEERLAKLDESRKTCSLPSTANMNTLSELLIELHHLKIG
jgi:hypothetical protein